MLAPSSHPLADIPASFTTGERWYVFYTHAQAEKLAQESIRDLGYPVFVPFEKRIQRLPRRKPRLYEVALFLRYGFVRFGINEPGWGAIEGAKGVEYILKPAGIPVAVPDWKIDALRVADTVGVFDRTKPPSVGMPVEVTEGPMAEFIGKIKRARTDDKMEVLLNLFGQEVTAVIPTAYLREV